MYELAAYPLIKASLETLYMVFLSSFISLFFGLILGTFLFITAKKRSFETTLLYRGLGFFVNVIRSIPFIILMISLIPLTRFLVGTSIGTNAAIVPLSIAAIPFFARICENALAEVSPGLIEAAEAMGATTWQLVSKVLLPESLSSLIRGASLTVIGLIGYSAMAGVVGGGGLGELAINYGYQRFDTRIMCETVILLLVMVQVIQVYGDRLAKRPRIKPILIVSLVLWAASLTYLLWPAALQTNTLRIGVMNGWPEVVMQAAKKVAKENYNLDLQIVTFTDYVQPNTALNNNSIDANIFQHGPYLEGQVAAHHYPLKAIAKTFVYPMGFYSQKIKHFSQLPEGALIAIPNDPSNGGRALLILQKAGLIRLRKSAGTLASLNDITANPHHLQFKLLDAAQLPRVLKDADLVAITNDFIGPAGLTIKQAILKEGSDSPYANLIVIRQEDNAKPIYAKLIAVMHSKPVLEETRKIFPDGAAVPAWHG